MQKKRKKGNSEATAITPDIIEKCLQDGEAGDAELLLQMYPNQLLYDHQEKSWFIWNGNYWQIDQTNKIKSLVSEKLASLYLFTGTEKLRNGKDGEDSSQKMDEFIHRYKRLKTASRVKNVLYFAVEKMAASNVWDETKFLLGTKTGVIDLKTGSFRSGKQEDYITKVIPTEWKGLKEKAPLWENFVQQVMGHDKELVAFLQRLLGYSISGSIKEHILPIFWGKGRNGKDTLLETILLVLGNSLSGPAHKQVVIGGNTRGAEPHIYALKGKRLVWASETDEKARLSAAQVKQITGGASIQTRALYKNMIEFFPTHTLCLVTNFKPVAAFNDYALWKRILLVPFNQSFVDNPQKENEHPRDSKLKEKLQQEASGILAWLVKGCLAWRKEGLCPPKTISNATIEYQQEQNPLYNFFTEYCNLNEQQEEKAAKLYQKYVDFVNSEKQRPITMTAFGKIMKEKFNKIHKNDGNYYVGIGLKN